MNQFNVLNWDINRNELEYYDVLPYFRKCYEECRKKDIPKTVDEWKEFIRQKGIYMFCSRCQYEIIISRQIILRITISYCGRIMQCIENATIRIVVEVLEAEVNIIWQE